MSEKRMSGIVKVQTPKGRAYDVSTRIQGKRHHRRFRTRKEAEEWLTSERRKAHAREVGLFTELVEITLADFCDHYRDEISPERKSTSSQERDRVAIKLLLEYMGDPKRLMSSIAPRDLRGLLSWAKRRQKTIFKREKWSKRRKKWETVTTERTRVRSNATVNRLGHTWRHLFAEAEREGHIASNPWRTVENLKETPPQERFLALGELQDVLSEARRYGDGPKEGSVDKLGRPLPEWKNRPAKYDFENLPDMILWLALMGTRRGEMFRVRWGDVDWERGIVTVDTLKLQSSKKPRRRAIPLHPDVATMLTARFERHRTTPKPGIVRKTDGTREMAEELIFPPDSTLRRKFQKCCERAGIAPARVHDLRHTTGTLLAVTESPATVASFLGHSRTATTDRYMHTGMETMKQAVARMPRIKATESQF